MFHRITVRNKEHNEKVASGIEVCEDVATTMTRAGCKEPARVAASVGADMMQVFAARMWLGTLFSGGAR